jgi:maltose alpha-D-glucosyltransferase/alpha-amylase
MSSWYQDAIIYELHVKTFQDGNGDGIGDFTGLISRLDYLERLGVTCVWLLPFYESPLLDDGYDIAHYERVHPQYGTLQDVRRFIDAAHDRGIRVITELVINHTSDRHPWFQAARHAPAGSDKRDFYVWSDTDQRYAGARIIFGDVERSNWTWDPVAGAYYWHRFFHHQPDLNFDNPHVRTAVLKVMRFWLAMGVDGLRLDAIAHLFEREGTSCDNLPETHAFLKDIRADLDARYPDRMLLAEANPGSDELTKYFGNGDQCHMAFHFPLMPRLFLALLREDPSPIVDVIRQTPSLPDGCQWALFLRNHDEVALSSVSEAEQQMLLEAYAPVPRMRLNGGIRRRLAPMLHRDERAIELAHALLFSLPGSPVVYYGDEIGMADNIDLPDRDGVRTPMEWDAVEAQERSDASLLARIRQLIHLRRQLGVFGRGDIAFVPTGNSRVLAFLRQLDGREVLVAANLARSEQRCAIELPSGRRDLTLGPQSCSWIPDLSMVGAG